MHEDQLLHLSVILINMKSEIFHRVFFGTSLLMFGKLNHIISNITFLNIFIRLSSVLSITLLIVWAALDISYSSHLFVIPM